MAFIDYYQTLGLNKNATDKDIKSAYRKLARQYHPDLNPNDTETNKKFQQVNEANEVLSDPEKRKKYDQYGEHWQHGEAYEQAQRQQQQQHSSYTGNNQESGYNYESFNDASGDFSNFFQSMFGGTGGSRSGRQSRYRGQDFNAELQLSLQDAAETHKQTLTVNGKNIRITIHAGVENGQTIKIAGHGGPGANNGPAGDLYITFSIAEDSRFKRSGNDLYRTVPVDLYTVILGGDLTIETLTGQVKLKVKPETANNSKVKLKGKGFPVYKKDGEFGDMYVTYDVQLPTQLTDKEKELFTQLAALKAQN